MIFKIFKYLFMLDEFNTQKKSVRGLEREESSFFKEVIKELKQTRSFFSE